MHHDSLANWEHSHRFLVDSKAAERRTFWVILLTGTTMIVEISAGLITNSMALLADGWHMGTHLAALSITAVAYIIARRHRDDSRYTFGTGKIGVLGGYTSAIFLGIIALAMAGESIHRLFTPLNIKFDTAILVAVVGLMVNLASVLILRENSHDHDHHDHPHHHDHNLRAAYLHVLADALTSFTAIFALLCGKLMGWNWMDPLMGIVGAVIISIWAYGLLSGAGAVLLDRQTDQSLAATIRKVVEADSDSRVSDLHIWRVSSTHYAAIISVVTHFPHPPQHYKDLLADQKWLSHVTVEVNVCPSASE